MLNESTFSILKDKVQAIEITQTTMKRLLGLAEIKLISAGSIGEEKLETNSLYPFLPVKRAYEMIQEILPSYEVTQTMNRLTEKIILDSDVKAKLVLDCFNNRFILFQTTIFDIKQSWWIYR